MKQGKKGRERAPCRPFKTGMYMVTKKPKATGYVRILSISIVGIS